MSYHYVADSKTQLIRGLLHERPATSIQLSKRTNLPRIVVSAVIWILFEQGHIQTQGVVPHPIAGRGRRQLTVYALTPRGHTVAQMPKRPATTRLTGSSLMTKTPGYTDRIRLALADAPATSQELSVLLGITPRQVSVGIWVLVKEGHVETTSSVSHPEYNGKGRKTLRLYSLTLRGQTVVKMRDRTS